MQVRKVYVGVNPGLLFDELKEFVQKQGMVIDQAKLETYPVPNDSSSFVHRGTLSFRIAGESEQGKECLRAHIVGQARTETKLIMDTDDQLFPADKLSRLQEDLDFIFGSYEARGD